MHSMNNCITMKKQTFNLFRPQNLCRCCGIEKNTGINVGDATNDRASKLLRILNLLPKRVINIKSTDKLPTFVCTDCEMTLTHFNNFCEMIKKVQKDLKSQLIPSSSDKNMHDKKEKQTDCHINGVSSVGCSVVIKVGRDGTIKCEDCQSDLVLSDLMNLHMLTHGLGSVSCACKDCGHRDDIGNFLQHEANCVKCPQCGFHDYQDRTGINQVKKLSTGDFACEVCDRKFHTRYKYNRHKLIHLGVKPFLCETCGMKFNQKISLKLHVMKHAKVDPYSCQWCGQSFRFKVSLQSHIINAHGSITETLSEYECDQCHKQFATRYKLSRHYRLHTGDRPYECSICNKRFSQTGNLKIHMKKHKSENSFTETFSTDQLIESDQILDTILDSCPQNKSFLDLDQQGQENYGLGRSGNDDKHNTTVLFPDFNPQDVLFDNTPIIPPQSSNNPIILPNFSSLQGGTTDINL